MHHGYTRLYRSLWNNKVLEEKGKPFSKREAFLYLVNVEARGMDDPESGLKRGEFEGSVRHLAKVWSWSRSAVHRFLTMLQTESMIEARTRINAGLGHPAGHPAGQFVGHFIICNYKIYNPVRDKNWDSKRDTQRDNIYKEENKGKKQRLKEPPPAAPAAAAGSLPSIEAYQLAELLRSAIARRDPNSRPAKMPDATAWAPDIDRLIRIHGRTPKEIQETIVYCQTNGCFWGPIILDGRSLCEKFDKVHGQMKLDVGGTNAIGGRSSERGIKTFGNEPDLFPVPK